MAAPSIQDSTDTNDPDLPILAAVAVCNSSITNLAGEVKSMKMEISIVRQDMQKLRERTSAVEGHISTLQDEWQPLQRDVKYTAWRQPMHQGWKTLGTASIEISMHSRHIGKGRRQESCGVHQGMVS